MRKGRACAIEEVWLGDGIDGHGVAYVLELTLTNVPVAVFGQAEAGRVAMPAAAGECLTLYYHAVLPTGPQIVQSARAGQRMKLDTFDAPLRYLRGRSDL